jgi:ATP/maltotriose-dependent transcriptional regulator MalT
LLCRALSALGYARQLRGEYAEAIAAFTPCLAQVRVLGQPGSTALCLNNLAWATVLAGDLAQASTLVEEALAIYAEDGEPNRMAAFRHTAGLLALETGDMKGAEREFVHSLRLIDVGSSGITPFALEGLGLAAIHSGRIERGLRLVGAAETIRRRSGQVGDPWWRERVGAAVARTPTLSAARVRAALDEGRRQPAQHAVDYALRDTWKQPAASTRLTKREHDVVTLVTQGLTNRQIAEALRVSERTVEAHLDHVRTKLGLRSRAQIAAWAAKHDSPDRASST